MSSICWECKYEHSDCKGDKWVEKVACQYFSKKLAINYPKRIEELERKVEFFESLYQGQLDANERLLLRADKLEAENKELKAKNEKLKAECNKYWCKADCNECDHRCRAWQNGFNAKGGNMSFDSVQMLRRIVEEVTPDWVDNNCISCAWFNNLKGVGGYCAYHNNGTTAKGGCNKWAKESDAE